MAIENRAIAEHITSEENCRRLETMLAEEIGEYSALPWKTRWLEQGKRTRKQEEAELLLKQAKQEVDSFIGKEYSVELPSLERKKSSSFEGLPISSYISNALFIGAGIYLTCQGNRDMTMIGGLMAGIGISKLIFLISAKTIENAPEYFFEENKIIWLKGREHNVLFDMMHEYCHAIETPVLGKSLGYRLFSEGFAEGASIQAMKKKESVEERKLPLFRSIALLDTARHHIKRQNKGKDDFGSLLKKLEENAPLKKEESILIASAGYAFFRLAEERHGTDVYRKALAGEESALFQ